MEMKLMELCFPQLQRTICCACGVDGLLVHMQQKRKETVLQPKKSRLSGIQGHRDIHIGAQINECSSGL